MIFGERLKDLREKANMTQKELGERLGISARLVSYYETGKNIPNDPVMLNKISAIFNTSLDSLLGGPDTQESKIHQLIKKLTEATQQNKLEWRHFYLNYNDYGYWTSDFSLNVSTNKSYKEGDEVVENESFYVDYKNGSYILVRIQNTQNELYKTALFIYYNNSFVFYASDEDISIIEDLFLTVKNQVLGIDSFVEAFLNDDLSEQQKKKTLKIDDEIPF